MEPRSNISPFSAYHLFTDDLQDILNERDKKLQKLKGNDAGYGQCRERTILNIQIKKAREKSKKSAVTQFFMSKKDIQRKAPTFVIKRSKFDPEFYKKQEKMLRMR